MSRLYVQYTYFAWCVIAESMEPPPPHLLISFIAEEVHNEINHLHIIFKFMQMTTYLRFTLPLF